MSTKRELLLSDQAIDQHELAKKLSNGNGASAEAIAFMVGMRKARELYEQARAKDAELIQHLVDAVDKGEKLYTYGAAQAYAACKDALVIAAAAGFKPN